MKCLNWRRCAGLLTAGGATTWFLLSYGGAAAQQDAKQAPPPKPVTMSLQHRAPAGAVFLFDGKPADITDKWFARGGTNPAGWKVEDGVVTVDGHDITSKQEFGDCQLHVEWRAILFDGKPKHDGNSGVGLQGRYEVQILDSYGKELEKHQCGALYSQIAPRVNACAKAGEWQTFDIIFRAPRSDSNGQVVEKPRMTVYQNGILIQNNQDLEGPTGIQYGEFKGMPATGPIVLQGDHAPVQFRNVWVVPL
jgi:hypothetical protein